MGQAIGTLVGDLLQQGPVGTAAVRTALLELLNQDFSSYARIEQLACLDPLLCAHLFRHAHQGERRFETIEQVSAALGVERLLRALADLPVLRTAREGDEASAYAQSVRRSYHNGCVVESLAVGQGYSHPRALFFAGLFQGIGELAVRALHPTKGRTVDRLQQAGASWSDAAERAWGIRPEVLSLELARAWRLPELVCASLDDEAPDERRCRIVRWSSQPTLRSGGVGLDLLDAAWLEAGSEATGHSVEHLQRAVFAASVRATRELADTYPHSTAETWTPLFPEPHRWPESREEAPVAAMAQADGALSPEGDIGTAVSAEEAIRLFAYAVQHELGKGRVVFALLSPDRRVLLGRYFLGVDKSASLHVFRFSRDGSSLFSRLLDRPQYVWVHAGNRAGMAALLNAEVRRVVGDGDFFAGSVFVGEKPLGLCYADAGETSAPLDAVRYARFKVLCLSLSKRLATLIPRPVA